MKTLTWTIVVGLAAAAGFLQAGCSCGSETTGDAEDAADVGAVEDALTDGEADPAGDEVEPEGGDEGNAADGEEGEGGDAADLDVEEDGVPPPCPDSTLVDVAIVAGTGEQIVPKVAMASEGHTWFSWYDNRSGNYNVMLQYLDPHGAAAFGADGLLVSDNRSETWVTDYSLAADPEGSVVVAFNDTRTGDFDVYAYRISPAGDFLWGDDGMALYPSPYDDMFPKIVMAGGGEVVFAWERYNPSDDFSDVDMQRVTLDGTLRWDPGVRIGAKEAGHSALRPWMAPGDGDTVIVIWIDTPNSMSYERIIFARKIDGEGASVWATDTVVVDEPNMPFFYDPKVISDGNGGIFVAWTSIYNDVQARSYLQHIDADGSATMPAGGVPLSTSMTTQQYQPALSFMPPANEVLAAWQESNMGQSEAGIYAQHFTFDGTPGWAPTGLELVPMSTHIAYMTALGPTEYGAVVFFADLAFVSPTNLRVQAGRLTLEDAPLWSPSILSGVDSGKSHPDVDGDSVCGYWNAWDDNRDDPGDVYAAFFPLD